MRICYLCPDPGVSPARNNGSARHLLSVVRGFAAAGHQVELLAACLDGAERLGVPAHAIRPPELSAALASFAAADSSDRAVARALRHTLNNAAVETALTTRIERFEPQLVYERYSPFSAAGASTCRRSKIPHVLEVNAPLAWEGSRHRGQALSSAADFLERAALEATDRIVAVSDELREQLIASGADPAKIDVVPNGVDTETFTPHGPSSPRYGSGSVVVGFSGSLKPWHGIELLIAAFRELAEDPRFHLLVVGQGPMSRELEALQDEYRDQITLTGAIDAEDVPRRLRAMDIAVAPYPDLERFYFSPLKVLEAMACGCAVIASRIGQPASVIRHGENGLLVPPGDVAALVAAVRALADDPERRRSLGRCAAMEARRLHSWRCRIPLLTGAVRSAA